MAGQEIAGALARPSRPVLAYDGGQIDSNRNIASIQAEQAMAEAESKERAESEIGQAMIGLDRAQKRPSIGCQMSGRPGVPARPSGATDARRLPGRREHAGASHQCAPEFKGGGGLEPTTPSLRMMCSTS